jgi:hypothetical protein
METEFFVCIIRVLQFGTRLFTGVEKYISFPPPPILNKYNFFFFFIF